MSGDKQPAHRGSHLTRLKSWCALMAAASVVLVGATAQRAKPSHVDITWMSITNMYYEIGPLRIVTDGYITRIPASVISRGGADVSGTGQRFKPDVDAVARVLRALGGPSSVNLLLTGHSHFDHSFDTGTWSKLTGARIIGSKTTCLQVVAQEIPANRCTVVNGGERILLGDGVTMYVVRWNHSGDPAINPAQHNPTELDAPPRPDSTGGFLPGVAEDFPNGGGNRGYLFVVDGDSGRFSWFFQNSASAVDLDVPIVVDSRNYGAPIENLKAALAQAKLDSVDLWIGTGGAPIARLVIPVLHPRAYLPVHWDGLYGAFAAGVPRVYADSSLEALLASSNVRLIKPAQYMDKWRLDRGGVRSIDNSVVKKTLGF
jgi:L-ascorbate metabolism protein UlaG (beta-lactamase superfamily)